MGAVGIGFSSLAFAQPSPFPVIGLFIFLKLLFEGHIFTSFLRTYLDGEERGRRSGVYRWFPFVYAAIACPVYYFAPLFFWSVLAYTLFIHLVRQQYGMMMFTEGSGATRSQTFLDGMAIYLVCLVPLLIFHCDRGPGANGWFQNGDLWTLPATVRPALVYFFWFVLIAYTLKLLFEGRKAAPRLLIFVSSGICFFATLTGNWNPPAMAALPVLHGLPYCFMVFHSREKKAARWERAVFHPSMILFLAIVFVLALIEVSFGANFANFRSGPHPWSLFAPGTYSHIALTFLIPALAAISFFHYFTDYYLWRGENRPLRWRKIRLPDTPDYRR